MGDGSPSTDDVVDVLVVGGLVGAVVVAALAPLGLRVQWILPPAAVLQSEVPIPGLLLPTMLGWPPPPLLTIDRLDRWAAWARTVPLLDAPTRLPLEAPLLDSAAGVVGEVGVVDVQQVWQAVRAAALPPIVLPYPDVPVTMLASDQVPYQVQGVRNGSAVLRAAMVVQARGLLPTPVWRLTGDDVVGEPLNLPAAPDRARLVAPLEGTRGVVFPLGGAWYQAGLMDAPLSGVPVTGVGPDGYDLFSIQRAMPGLIQLTVIGCEGLLDLPLAGGAVQMLLGQDGRLDDDQ